MTMTLKALSLAVLCASAVLPGLARADRGAYSVEGGGILTAVRVDPAVGTGGATSGTLGGAILGLRYGLTNNVDLTLGGTWLNPAEFYHQGVVVPCNGTECSGQLSGQMGRITASAGADYVMGLRLRFHVGAELGWAEVSFTQLQHSSGTPIATSRTIDGLLIAPRVGLEWAATDHLSFAITPRVEMLIGEPQLAFSVPFTVAYSWYR
jgi:hypothetical protein